MKSKIERETTAVGIVTASCGLALFLWAASANPTEDLTALTMAGGCLLFVVGLFVWVG